MSSATLETLETKQEVTQSLWTAEDVARLCPVKATTVRAWAKSGKIPSVRRVGIRFLFDPEAVRAALGV